MYLHCSFLNVPQGEKLHFQRKDFCNSMLSTVLTVVICERSKFVFFPLRVGSISCHSGKPNRNYKLFPPFVKVAKNLDVFPYTLNFTRLYQQKD